MNHILNYFKTKSCEYCDQIMIQIGTRWFSQHNEKHEIINVVPTVTEPPQPEVIFVQSELDDGIVVNDEKDKKKKQTKPVQFQKSLENERNSSDDESIRDHSDVGFQNIDDDTYHDNDEKEKPSKPSNSKKRTIIESKKRSKDDCVQSKAKISKLNDSSSSNAENKTFILKEADKLPHRCTSCKKVLNNKLLAYQHVHSVHKIPKLELKNYVKSIDENKSQDPKPSTSGIATLTPRKIKYQCYICKTYKPSKGKLLSHFKQSHSEPTKKHPIGFLICNVCGERMNTIEEITKHVEESHTEEDFLQPSKKSVSYCHICKQFSKNKFENLMHIYNNHKKEIDVFNEINWSHIFNRSKNGYNCIPCEKNYKNGEAYCWHLRDDHRNEYDNLEALKLGLILTCDKCTSPYLFNRKEEGRCCLVSKRGERRVTCEMCGKIMLNGVTFRDHMNTHSGQKPYQCKICFISYSSSSRLRKHKLNKHERREKKRFKCTVEFCDKDFADRVGWKRHLFLTHNIIKNKIDCEICGKSFPYPQILKEHIKKEHQFS